MANIDKLSQALGQEPRTIETAELTKALRADLEKMEIANLVKIINDYDKPGQEEHAFEKLDYFKYAGTVLARKLTKNPEKIADVRKQLNEQTFMNIMNDYFVTSSFESRIVEIVGEIKKKCSLNVGESKKVISVKLDDGTSIVVDDSKGRGYVDIAAHVLHEQLGLTKVQARNFLIKYYGSEEKTNEFIKDNGKIREYVNYATDKIGELGGDYLDELQRHGLIGVAGKTFNDAGRLLKEGLDSTNMTPGQKKTWSQVGKVGMALGAIFLLFKGAKEMMGAVHKFGFWKTIGTFLVGEVAYEATTGRSLFELVGKAFTGGLDSRMIPFANSELAKDAVSSGSAAVKSVAEKVMSVFDKNPSESFDYTAAWFVNQTLYDLKISQIAKYSKPNGSNLKFDVQKLLNDNVLGSYRQAFLSSYVDTIGYDAANDVISKGLIAHGIDGTNISSISGDKTIKQIGDEMLEKLPRQKQVQDIRETLGKIRDPVMVGKLSSGQPQIDNVLTRYINLEISYSQLDDKIKQILGKNISQLGTNSTSSNGSGSNGQSGSNSSGGVSSQPQESHTNTFY